MNGLQQFRQWFFSLERRERLVLAGGGVILFFILLYIGIVNPYISHRRSLNDQITQQNELLAWMRPAALQLQSLQGTRPGNLPGGSLLSAVNNSVAGVGLAQALQQAQQASDGSVRAQFNGAEFDSLIRWLDTLHKNYGITVADMSVTRASGPGLVNVNLKLQGATQ
jgi:general secretion pathway protein M